MPGSICCVCGLQDDCRPYGKDGTAICFPCMKATPEREAEAQKQLAQCFDKIDAAGGVAVIDKGGVRKLEPLDLLSGTPVVISRPRGGSR